MEINACLIHYYRPIQLVACGSTLARQNSQLISSANKNPSNQQSTPVLSVTANHRHALLMMKESLLCMLLLLPATPNFSHMNIIKNEYSCLLDKQAFTSLFVDYPHFL